jgi:hypothetical protein
MSFGTNVNIEDFLGVTDFYYHFGGAVCLYVEGPFLNYSVGGIYPISNIP